MTLRQALGGDSRHVHDLLEQLMDQEDALVVLIDSRRAISYAEGLGLSACQLEFVTNEIEQAVRGVTGRGASSP